VENPALRHIPFAVQQVSRLHYGCTTHIYYRNKLL
jgi:hypothetical protein